MNVNAKTLLWDLALNKNSGSLYKLLNSLRKIMQRYKHKFSAKTATISCFIFPFSSLAKVAYFFH